MSRRLAVLFAFLALTGPCMAQEHKPAFLFVGSYHMNNHNRDMFNLKASDVTSPARQKQMLEVVRALEAFAPTKIMIERDVADQADITAQLQDTCSGKRPASKEEYEQIGFRIACKLKIPVVAVNYNALGPIEDAKKIDLGTADPKAWKEVQALGDSDNARQQQVEATRTVGEILKYLNSDEKTREVASRYYLLAKLASPTEPVGANWVEYWYGRNLTIFNNIAKHTVPEDRVLVIYGSGHGYILRRMAEESGFYEVLNTQAFLEQHL